MEFKDEKEVKTEKKEENDEYKYLFDWNLDKSETEEKEESEEYSMLKQNIKIMIFLFKYLNYFNR